MANAFMASAARSKREQAAIERAVEADEEYKVLNVRIPASLHRKAALHRIETGESTTQLVVRLLADELSE